ncbi:MAG: hypothetical protein AMXMBFR64_39660 [Myxococcales bacterium]
MRSRDHELLRAIGQRVGRARSERGWTQERLAEATEMDPVTVSRWESGQRALSLSTLARIADVLGVGLGDLLDVGRELPTPEHSAEELELLRGFAALTTTRRDLVIRLVRELGR